VAYQATGATDEATLQRINDWIDTQEKIRMVQIVALVGGLLYTMAQFGEITARFKAMRDARKAKRGR